LIGDGLWYCYACFSLENYYFTVLWRDFSGGTGYLGRVMGTVQGLRERLKCNHGGMARIGHEGAWVGG
jgi:hypothetical protein